MPRYDDKKILNIIRMNNQEIQFSVEFLARKLGCSVSYLREISWFYFNLPPGRLIENIRLEKVIDLLLVGDLSIYDISWHSGYKNIKTLRNQLKKRFGVSPTELKIVLENCKNQTQTVSKFKSKLWCKSIGKPSSMK